MFNRVVAPGGPLAILAGLVLFLGGAAPAGASLLIVPDDQATIQAALDAAMAGDTIEVRQQVYHEKIAFPRSGNAVDGYITLQAFPGDKPVLDGTGVSGSNMVLIEDRSYVKLIGFEIRNDLGVNDGSGVRFLGSGSNIEIRDNEIHDIRGQHAMGITVYGTGATPISNLIIDGNEIHDCEPFRSEALTLNGNVTDFQVTNNVVRDVNNIGIDFIGGESDIQPDSSKVARNGVCRGNTVLRAREQGGGYAGGIYVDGGRDIVIENNTVSGCDLGIEIGAENSGIVASGVIVRDNLVFANEKAGIVFGGYKSSVGRTKSCQFLNNTCYENDTLGEGLGELWIQYAEDNQIRNNVFYSTSQNVLLYSEAGNVNNTLDYNLWYTEAGAGSAEFVWQGTSYGSFAAYRAASRPGRELAVRRPRFLRPPRPATSICREPPRRSTRATRPSCPAPERSTSTARRASTAPASTSGRTRPPFVATGPWIPAKSATTATWSTATAATATAPSPRAATASRPPASSATMATRAAATAARRPASSKALGRPATTATSVPVPTPATVPGLAPAAPRRRPCAACRRAAASRSSSSRTRATTRATCCSGSGRAARRRRRRSSPTRRSRPPTPSACTTLRRRCSPSSKRAPRWAASGS